MEVEVLPLERKQRIKDSWNHIWARRRPKRAIDQHLNEMMKLRFVKDIPSDSLDFSSDWLIPTFTVSSGKCLGDDGNLQSGKSRLVWDFRQINSAYQEAFGKAGTTAALDR